MILPPNFIIYINVSESLFHIETQGVINENWLYLFPSLHQSLSWGSYCPHNNFFDSVLISTCTHHIFIWHYPKLFMYTGSTPYCLYYWITNLYIYIYILSLDQWSVNGIANDTSDSLTSLQCNLTSPNWTLHKQNWFPVMKLLSHPYTSQGQFDRQRWSTFLGPSWQLQRSTDTPTTDASVTTCRYVLMSIHHTTCTPDTSVRLPALFERTSAFSNNSDRSIILWMKNILRKQLQN